MTNDNRICANCIQDEHMQRGINEFIGTVEECDYCGENRPTIALWDLMIRCDEVIEVFFEVSSLTPAVLQFGRDPQGKDLETLISEILGVTGAAKTDLHELLDYYWFDRDTMDYKYGEDPWFVESSESIGQIGTEWEHMEQSLRDTARLFNPAAAAVLEKIFAPVIDDRTRAGHQVITKIGPAHQISGLLRAREFESLHELERALCHPESSLGPPPVGVGSAGRMNCAGIPVFYGATKALTAIAEVRPAVGAHVAIGLFQVVRELSLLDLTKLGDVSSSKASKFDPITVERTIRNNFLKTLVTQLTMPVLPSRAGTDYLITQAIADFLATHPKLNLDGIIFPSTQAAEEESSGRNVVLFRKASKVLRATREYDRTASAYLFEYEENSAWFAPVLESEPSQACEPSLVTWPADHDRFEAALELDRDSIWIHKILAVHFKTDETPVRHVRAESRQESGERMPNSHRGDGLL
ncbi:RES family NAD+ phosphorylase [Janthinobacterium sp. OK676]|uniref:RES family NAD+ phosphorylase n=1 Tax=Janthinobacterium sp. OK676 TaxID=1855295 RepID=UPI000B81AEDB|nr:RES family NAD+ phosphorylase [Janthinobacterium sp. OK676]